MRRLYRAVERYDILHVMIHDPYRLTIVIDQ